MFCTLARSRLGDLSICPTRGRSRGLIRVETGLLPDGQPVYIRVSDDGTTLELLLRVSLAGGSA